MSKSLINDTNHSVHHRHDLTPYFGNPGKDYEQKLLHHQAHKDKLYSKDYVPGNDNQPELLKTL